MTRLRKKPRSIFQFIIDLTPLLDVIFILLIVVLSSEDYAETAEQKYTEASKIYDEAVQKEAEYDTFKEQLNTYEELTDYVNIVTLNSVYRYSNIKLRDLYVVVNGGEVKNWEINPSNESTVWAECQSYIEEGLAGREDTPTIIRIQDAKMLYRDEQSILSMCDDLKLKDKYIKNYTESADE